MKYLKTNLTAALLIFSGTLLAHEYVLIGFLLASLGGICLGLWFEMRD
jgi:ABC-type nitrate/sulfonate/bicarbonate transport system permease component